MAENRSWGSFGIIDALLHSSINFQQEYALCEAGRIEPQYHFVKGQYFCYPDVLGEHKNCGLSVYRLEVNRDHCRMLPR